MKQSSNEGNETLHVVAFTDVPATLRTFLTFLSDQTNIVFHVVTNEVELVDAMRNFSVEVIAMPRVSIPAWWECESHLAKPLAVPRFVASVDDPGWSAQFVHDLGFDGLIVIDVGTPAYQLVRKLHHALETAPTRGSRAPLDRAMLIDHPTLDSVTGADEINRKILALLSIGRENREIAGAVCLSPQTVRNRVSAMLHTSGMANRTQLAVYYVHRMAQDESIAKAKTHPPIHTIYRAS